MTTVESTKVLCPLFDNIEILIPGDSLSIFLPLDLWTKCEILIRYRKEENDFSEAVHHT